MYIFAFLSLALLVCSFGMFWNARGWFQISISGLTALMAIAFLALAATQIAESFPKPSVDAPLLALTFSDVLGMVMS